MYSVCTVVAPAGRYVSSSWWIQLLGIDYLMDIILFSSRSRSVFPKDLIDLFSIQTFFAQISNGSFSNRNSARRQQFALVCRR